MLLKHFLRRLPEAIIPRYDECIEIAQSGLKDCKIETLFKALPEHNRELLKYLANFLFDLSAPENVKHTKMEMDALVVVFVPQMLRCAVADYAIALRNQSLEQNFVKALFTWIRNNSVQDEEEKAKSPAPSVISNPQRSPCGKPMMKRRKSTLEDEEEDEEEEEEDN